MEDLVCPQCGAEDYHIEPAGPHNKAVCNCCNAYIKFVAKPHQTPKLFFGKYAGREIKLMVSEEEISYLRWLYHNARSLKAKTLEAIRDHLQSLNRL